MRCSDKGSHNMWFKHASAATLAILLVAGCGETKKFGSAGTMPPKPSTSNQQANGVVTQPASVLPGSQQTPTGVVPGGAITAPPRPMPVGGGGPVISRGGTPTPVVAWSGNMGSMIFETACHDTWANRYLGGISKASAGVAVVFFNSDGSQVNFPISQADAQAVQQFIMANPNRIKFRVPAVADGTYDIALVEYSHLGSVGNPVKNLRDQGIDPKSFSVTTFFGMSYELVPIGVLGFGVVNVVGGIAQDAPPTYASRIIKGLLGDNAFYLANKTMNPCTHFPYGL